MPCMFQYCQNEEEAKKLYHRLAKRLHPDSGGENELMILLQKDYDIALNRIKPSALASKFYDADGVKPPPTPSPPSKPAETVPIGDQRLEFMKKLIELLKNVAVSPNVRNFIIYAFKFQSKNRFLTIQQYKALKHIYEQLVVSSIRPFGMRGRSQPQQRASKKRL
jgi:hypothetical protein